MKKITKKDNANPNIGKDKETIKQERQDLQQTILQLTNAKTGERFTDESLDRESLKYQLKSGRVICILSQWNRI